MNKCKLLGMALLFSIIFSGCTMKGFVPERKEIEDFEIIRAIGIDKSPDNPDDIRLTVISRMEKPGSKSSESEGSSGKGSGSKLMASDGKTVSEALKKIHSYNEKQVFFGHADFFIIGEEAAREDLIKYLDILSRARETRLNSLVFVVRGATAQELLQISQQSSIFVPDLLKVISENVDLSSVSGRLEQVELMGELDNKYSQIIIPALKITKKMHLEKGESGPLHTQIELEGYAIIKNVKLITFSDMQQSMGINFVKNTFRSGIINVKDSVGKEVALEVVESNTKIIPRISGTTVSVLIKVDVASNIIEMHSTMDIFKENELSELERKQSDIIRQYILDAIKLAQSNDTDILGIADKTYHKHPVKWQSIKERWNEIFPGIKFDVQVKSIIKRSHEINQPNRSKVGEGE